MIQAEVSCGGSRFIGVCGQGDDVEPAVNPLVELVMLVIRLRAMKIGNWLTNAI